MAIDNRPSLDIAFSSLSVAPTERSLRALTPGFTTSQTVENLVQLRAYLGHPVSVSLHNGLLLNTRSAVDLFRANGVSITSLDRTDAYQIHDLIKDIARDAWRSDWNTAVVDGARWLHNVPFDWTALLKVRSGIKSVKQFKINDERGIILRTHAGHWTLNGGKSGERIRRSLRGTRVSLALEIFADTQTQNEYRQVVEDLAKSNNWDVPVLYDVDLGHIDRSKSIHDARSEGKGAVDFFRSLVDTRGDLLGVTSLNSYKDGDVLTHKGLLSGTNTLKFAEVAGILGEAAKEGKIHPRVLAVIESMPFELKQWFSKEARVFIHGFQTSFEQALAMAV